MKSALTTKVNTNSIVVLEDLKLDGIKTKDFANILKNLPIGEKALIVNNEVDKNIILSARNLPNVKTTLVSTLNVYDILKYDTFVVTKDAALKIEEVYA